VFSDERLGWLLEELRAIPHVEIVRLGTRLPVTLPFRITDALCGCSRIPPALAQHALQPPEGAHARGGRRARAARRRGHPDRQPERAPARINDDRATMQALCEGLVRLRVRPYYCYQAQLLEGTAHFRVPIEDGVALFRALRGRTSGFAIPQYVLDTPYGKVPLAHPYLRGREGRRRRGRDLRRAAVAGAEPRIARHNPGVGGAQDRPGPRLGRRGDRARGQRRAVARARRGREMVLTRVLGAGAEADAYRAAFLLPDLLNYFLAGGALSIAFIPFYTRLWRATGMPAADRFLAVIFGTTGALAIAATRAVARAPSARGAAVSGFSAEQAALTGASRGSSCPRRSSSSRAACCAAR
jgi:hypothetical protein